RVEVTAGPEGFTALLTHIGFDPWSLELLTADLAAAYAAQVTGTAPRWRSEPPPPAARIAQLDRQPVPGMPAHATRSATVTLPEGIPAGLPALGVAPATVFLAAHLVVLATLTGRASARTGVVVDGRPRHVHAERYVGTFSRIRSLSAGVAATSW